MGKHLYSGLYGFVGCMLIAAVAFYRCQPGQGCISGAPVWLRISSAFVSLLGLAALVISWFQVRKISVKNQWIVFAIWVLPFLLAPPVLSKDAIAYADQGWIFLQGYDPYLVGMGMIGGPYATQVDGFWQGTTTVYPALALAIQAFIVDITGAHPHWAIVAMRAPALIGVILIGLGIPEIASRRGRNPRTALWGTLLNPLVVIHFVGGAHNDALATGLAVAAVALALMTKGTKYSWAWLVSSMMVGLAMGIKQTLGLAVVAVALVAVAEPGSDPLTVFKQKWWPALWRTLVGLVVTLASFIGVTVWSGLSFGWATGTGAPFTVGTNSPSYMICAGLAYLPGTNLNFWLSSVGMIIFLVGVAAIAVLLWHKGMDDPVAFLGWGLCIFAVASPSLQPWYLMWGGVFLAAVKLKRKHVTMVLAVSICGVLTAIMQEYEIFPIVISTIVAAIAYIPLFKSIERRLPHTSLKWFQAEQAAQSVNPNPSSKTIQATTTAKRALIEE